MFDVLRPINIIIIIIIIIIVSENSGKMLFFLRFWSRGGYTADAEIKDPLRGAQGYHGFLCFQSVVGQNGHFHAEPADRASTWSTFCFPNSSQFILTWWQGFYLI